ncbi:MAG: family 43 glycosylhydrolase [Candidatus Marinimicrobia bacterium]|nr:family 43 glycosylhydrolase [Candidatus Neomarinimicrobiota bacterium]
MLLKIKNIKVLNNIFAKLVSNTLILTITVLSGSTSEISPKAHNPIIWADVPDPSVITVDSCYYMSSTTMHMCPGVPIMKSKDLVNWEIVNYVYDTLSNSDEMNLENGKNAYGKGSWASCLRYHNGFFYLVTFSYTTNKTYIFKTDDIENGVWERSIINQVCHDPSLLFDDDGKVYLVYGIDNIKVLELTEDVTAIKHGGLNRTIIESASKIAGTEFYVAAEGSHIHKIRGKYYIFLISWPKGGMRTQLVFRSERITGPYEGKIALKYEGIAQGGLVESIDGKWYALLFQDHGSVGRIPCLVPVTWENGWPVFGIKGKVPTELDIPVKNDSIPKIVSSDDFEWTEKMPLVWQWNHNPDNRYWSTKQRPGYLRLINGRVDRDFTETRNTLTQRTFGPRCSGEIKMDTRNMKDGDIAGLGLLQEIYGFVAVRRDGEIKNIVMVNSSAGRPEIVESVLLEQDTVFLRVSCDLENRSDSAYFYYSLDGVKWIEIGNILKMEYRLSHFMGYKFALFNYATKSTGGYVDFDFFHIDDSLTKLSEVEEQGYYIPDRFNLYPNYPNPFNTNTVICYQLPEKSGLNIKVTDILGQEVCTLFEGIREPGIYEITLDSRNLTSGVYFFQLRTNNNFVITRKFLVLK